MNAKPKQAFLLVILALAISGEICAAPHMEILPAFSDARLDAAKSLQGLQNRAANEKIWINRNANPFWPDIFQSKYGYNVTWFSASNTDAGLMTVLNQYTDTYDGYILYDESANEISKFVALSLAGIKNAVVIDASLEASFISDVGKPKLMDVSTRDAAWLWANYGSEFSRTGMGLPNTMERTHSADYAIMQGWAFVPGIDQTVCELFLGNLDPNATLTGWVPPYLAGQEDAMVSYFSGFDAKLIAGVNTLHNFSAIEGICDYSSGSKEPITFRQNMDKSGYAFDPSKHYVTLCVNSGGNFNYLHNRYLTDTGNSIDSDNWMNVPHTVPLTLMMAPMATEIAAAALREIYDLKSPQDSFSTPYSGHAYIHPSRYTSLAEFASEASAYMERADQTCLASQETGNIINQRWVDNYGATLLASNQVKGLFCQQGPFGKIYKGPDDKPVITRRTGMNISDSPANMASFINLVNSWQPNPYDETGYSVIQVNFETTNIQDCQELYENVSPHIEFVTLEELFYHIRHQVFGVPIVRLISPPENVIATAGDGEIALAWDAQPEAIGYVINKKRGWNGSFSTLTQVTENVYTNMGLISGEGYYYTIAAIYEDAPDPDVKSAPSAQVGASPRTASSSSVLTDFMVDGGNPGSSIDLTWSNLTGPVELQSSGAAVPLIDSVQNTLTETDGVSGVIKMNVLAVDDLSSRFVPSTWSGGGQSAGNSVSAATAGWGVRRDGKINGALQDPGEALILTFDLSALALGKGQSVVLKKITFWGDTDDSRNGDIWMRDFNAAEGDPVASIQLADNVIVYTNTLTISDGDKLALMRGSKDTRLATLEIDITQETSVFELWMNSLGVYGKTDTDPYGDVDGDTLASLYEYGVGGNPVDPESSGIAPKMTRIVQDGGTNYIEYVHIRRYNPANSVSVHPETASNLIAADWTNAHYEVVSSAPIDDEFETVTNRIDTIDPVRMIRLKVE